ncbi:hypothetical protein FRZ67_22590 [Panacibacter ginsenosidivorans]|uniref:Uncharacterized protein n=1 Tax=Panacibacter ginsenosidivorans TaxID=1813871 RepID=A0A5B8VI38_9BACT|nr:hypothetical protein [Panacibacter ginsenosidivorans]QEC69948.1 hypothetical protein FRZ67_22590 [Panacibacter ginsenosidivorans]
MPNFENKIAEVYMKKIHLYFLYDWIVVLIPIALIFISLLNNLDDPFYQYWEKNLFLGIWILVPIIKLWISKKIKDRLICEIVIEEKNVLLQIYNGSILKLDKSFIPLKKEKADYFINTLFSPKMGTIRSYNKDILIVRVDYKKYYLAPGLFEQEDVQI